MLEGQATGALSGFLAAELGEALGLEGFGGQLFTTVASRSVGHVLNTVVKNLLLGDLFGRPRRDHQPGVRHRLAGRRLPRQP